MKKEQFIDVLRRCEKRFVDRLVFDCEKMTIKKAGEKFFKEIIELLEKEV